MILNRQPRAEHPNPMCVRDSWHNLNGIWECEIDNDKKLNKDSVFTQKINVPFAPESVLSGIGITDFIKRIWYRRHLNISKCSNFRTLLHFGACDYETNVWINEEKLETHFGGQASFTYDITDYLVDGDNVITLCVDDDTCSPLQPSGKQSMLPHSHGCYYTRTTGIWQTVWLEFVPKNYIHSFKFYPDAENVSVRIEVEADGEVEAYVFYKYCLLGQGKGKDVINVKMSEKHLWEPGHGRLYTVILRCGEDKISSYFGLRSTQFNDGKYLLNGKSVFQRLVLDQGFYPDGIYTAPTRNALENDINISLACGFNGARLHQKVFEPLFLHYCDTRGYIVWGEFPSWGVSAADDEGKNALLSEWKEVIDRDFNHPSIIGWCPLNETMYDKFNDENAKEKQAENTKEIYYFTKKYDPTRPCIDASGGIHYETDCYDIHDYEQDPKVYGERYDSFANGGTLYDHYSGRQNYDRRLPLFISEYGGTAINPEEGAWGYGNCARTSDELVERFTALSDVLLRNELICGLCYTQLYDIEQEKNGLYTYDRQPKADPELFKNALYKKAAIEE